MTTVLFACVHNAGRSQMAAAFFNQLADPSVARAVSAGTHPAEAVHTEVVASMRQLGVNLDARPQLLTPEFANRADLLITMGCEMLCPAIPGIAQEDWRISDPKGQPPERVAQIRDQIQERARELVTARGWARPELVSRPR